MYNSLINFVKNATGGVLEKIVNKNPDLRLELYSLPQHFSEINYVCMYVWMDGRMDGWMDGWMDVRHLFIFLKCDRLIRDLGDKFKQKQIYLF